MAGKTSKIIPNECMTLYEIADVVIPPNQRWTLIGRDVKKNFVSGKNGLMLGELYAVIAKIYNKLANQRPLVIIQDNDGNEIELPFYGEHIFIEEIKLNYSYCTATLTIRS